MKRKFFCGLFFSLFVSNSVALTNEEYKSIFGSRDGCFLLREISKNEPKENFNINRCQMRFSPCSTFKPVLALMGFETGIFKDTKTIIKWDGKHWKRNELNQDQTPITWIKYSVNWVNDWIVPKLGLKRINNFLSRFKYGNEDYSGGERTLKISPQEQIIFIEKLWAKKLPLSMRSIDLTKEILFTKKLSNKAEIYGKTGSCCIDQGCENGSGRQLAWFVGVLRSQGHEYAFITNFSDLAPSKGYAGGKAKEITDMILLKSGLIRT